MLKSQKLLIMVAAGLMLGGCETCMDANSPQAHVRPANSEKMVAVVNQRCPIEPAHAVQGRMAEPDCVVEWHGKKVGMCCDHCVPQWKKMSDAEKDAALANAMK